MRRTLRNLIFAVLRYSGIPFLLRELVQRNKVTILVFHAPSVERAASYFRALQKRYNIIPLQDYIHARTNGGTGKLPPKSLVITLDDGHASNFELRPLLQEFRLPVTIFLCSGLVGTNRHFWWFHTRGRNEAAACKTMPDPDRLEFLAQRNYTPAREYGDRHALSGAEIEDLMPLVDFQAHTVTHPILPLCTEDTARQEVEQCKRDLELGYRLSVRALAFPNGDYSEREIGLAQGAGYACALTLDFGFNDAHTDLFRLRRIPILDDASISELLVKASGLWGLLKWGGNSARCPKKRRRCGEAAHAPRLDPMPPGLPAANGLSAARITEDEHQL